MRAPGKEPGQGQGRDSFKAPGVLGFIPTVGVPRRPLPAVMSCVSTEHPVRHHKASDAAQEGGWELARPPQEHQACRTQGCSATDRQAGAVRAESQQSSRGQEGVASNQPSQQEATSRPAAGCQQCPKDRLHRSGGQIPGGKSPANFTQQSQGQPA